jgi:hypothetical protein
MPVVHKNRTPFGPTHGMKTLCGIRNGVYYDGGDLAFRQIKAARAWKDVTCKNCLRVRQQKAERVKRGRPIARCSECGHEGVLTF